MEVPMQPRKNPWLVLMVFSLGLFMTLLDLTIVNIAIPSIVDDLKAPLDGIAVVLGPTLGGLIVANWGWRWIFYVNIPIGVALVVAAFAFVPDLRIGKSHRLDLVGVALASAGLLLVVFGLIEGRFDWGTV